MFESYPRHLLLTLIFALETVAADVPAASVLFLVGLAVAHVSRKVTLPSDRKATP